MLPLPPAAISNSRGEFLLNGEFVVSMFKREIKVGSAVIEYSGSDHVIERINCTDRIEEEIIVQVVLVFFYPFFCESCRWQAEAPLKLSEF